MGRRAEYPPRKAAGRPLLRLAYSKPAASLQGSAVVRYCMKNRLEETACPASECLACGGLGVAADCPACAGRGNVLTRTKREAELAHMPMFERCEVCRGTGQLPLSRDLANRLGLLEDTSKPEQTTPPTRAHRA